MITQGLRIALRTTRARSHPRLMSTAVPVIDFSGMEGGAADKAKVVQEVREAAENVGFLAVKGHGVPQATIDEVWSRTREFFDQPEELKARGTEMTDTYPYGYIPFGGETLSAGRDAELGDGGEEAMAPSDLNESFAVGPNRPVLEGPYKLPPLKWPSHDQAEEFKAAWLAYYGEMELLSARLLRCFALALELEENWFDDKITNHRSAMRALNYPDLPEAFRPSPGQMRASAHTDYGSLTILLQEDAPGGLQVRPVKAGDTSLGEEGWHPVPARPGHFVVNLGDLMRRWTNDKWASTLHRVVVPPADKMGSSRRQSIAFFHNINPDHVVSAIPTTVEQNASPLYEPIEAQAFLMQKHLAATGGQ